MKPTQMVALFWVGLFIIGQLEFWSITSRHISNCEIREAGAQANALLWWPLVALIMAFVTTRTVWILTRERY